MRHTNFFPVLLLCALGLPPAAAAQAQHPDAAAAGLSRSSRSPSSEPVGSAIPRLFVGVDPNPKTSTTYKQRDWAESIKLMRTTASTELHFAKTWTEIEPTPGNYDLADEAFILQESAPLRVAFNLRLVDAGQRNMPDAYRGLAWDSAEMIQHVTDAVDAMAPLLRGRVWSYAVGNEIDMYFDQRPGEIAAFARMLQAVRPHVQEQHPLVRFTTSFQFQARDRLRTSYAPIVATLDHVTFTYYPLAANFDVRPPASAVDDIAAMIAVAQPKAIYLQEIGYPSAALLGSSPEQQALFVRLAFETIRRWGSTYVLGAAYLFQAEMPEWLLDEVSRAFGNTSDRFRAFIRSLGLRDADDRPKPGWDEYVRQADLVRQHVAP